MKIKDKLWLIVVLIWAVFLTLLAPFIIDDDRGSE